MENYIDITRLFDPLNNIELFEVGDIYITTGNQNPAEKFKDTVWEKDKNHMFMGWNIWKRVE